ncbi:MAG: Bax inhibitor-1/YccA family protein [Methylomonas sp.]|nr:Bax inhibitor-1/YccA family protein [Methylomonas sp.]PPD20024.1 MAG: BAX inhibitor protein [Methylomonas sp.]PPD25887.1 MAG: BAX inhibitor protein [Methylomonas sp.]PPD37333.1 MAG: BAX inhibitor protein [Methylomonas sp.]PPD40125.1 MAG: BAX inhibitor protein [Methylomonas sp.]
MRYNHSVTQSSIAKPSIAQSSGAGILATHRVLRNTYLLLSMTLLFSAGMAGVAMTLDLPHPGLIITLVGYFGLLFLTHRFSHSALGIVFVFALTGFMGMTLGPILNMYLKAFANGQQLIFMALAGTGLTFLGLSAYALVTRKDFSFMAGFLMTGIWVAFFAGLAALLFSVPALSLAVSAMFVLLMAAMILFQTSQIIHGGETNYILATVTLYVSLYNLFTSLLQLLGVFGGDD